MSVLSQALISQSRKESTQRPQAARCCFHSGNARTGFQSRKPHSLTVQLTLHSAQQRLTNKSENKGEKMLHTLCSDVSQGYFAASVSKVSLTIFPLLLMLFKVAFLLAEYVSHIQFWMYQIF